MAYDAKKIYYRFDDHLSRLVLDYEASRQISSESESLYHGLPTDPYDEGLFVLAHADNLITGCCQLLLMCLQ